VQTSDVAQTLHIKMKYRIPNGLTKDRGTRSTKLAALPIESTVTLYPGVRRVDIETRVDNRARDHKLRVHFPTGIAATEAWADSSFDVLSRPVGRPAVGQDYREKPVPTWPQQHFVDVHSVPASPGEDRVPASLGGDDGVHGLMVASDGLPEYEVLTDNGGTTIAVTLLRCVGWLSRDDLLTRQGNAGPSVATPGAQCLGAHCFRYSLIPHQGGWETALASAHEFTSPLRATVAWGGPPESLSHSLVEVQPGTVIVSAVKQPEEGQGLVVRVYNPLSTAVDLRVNVGLPFETATLANLREEPSRYSIPQQRGEETISSGARFTPAGCFEMRLPAKRIQTILFR